MAINKSLQVVHDNKHEENYELRRIIAERHERIEKLRVDRSILKTLPDSILYRNISPEMERYEPRLIEIRQNTTELEKIQARRILAAPHKSWDLFVWLKRILNAE